MNPKTCLRCDWQGETGWGTCPNCGERPLYVVGASPSEVPGTGSQHDERNHEAANTTATAPSDTLPSDQTLPRPQRRRPDRLDDPPVQSSPSSSQHWC